MRGGKRSTSIKQGEVRNPHGRNQYAPEIREARAQERKIIVDVKEAAKEMTPIALETLKTAMTSPNAPFAARVSAATEVLNRGWGKTKETVDHTMRTTLEDLVMESYRPRAPAPTIIEHEPAQIDSENLQ